MAGSPRPRGDRDRTDQDRDERTQHDGDGGRQVDLDPEIGQAATHRARQAVAGLRFAVHAFDAPTMAGMDSLVVIAPPLAPPPGAQQRGAVVTDHHRLVDAPTREAEPGQVAAPAILGARGEEPAMLRADRPSASCRLAR